MALSFLRNFGVLSGVSGALSVLSAGVGSLAGDQQAQKERQEARQDRQIRYATALLLCGPANR